MRENFKGGGGFAFDCEDSWLSQPLVEGGGWWLSMILNSRRNSVASSVGM